MPNPDFLFLMNQTLIIILWMSLPILGVALVVGLTIGLLQAVTQIQDQSLPQTAKLVAVMVTLAVLGPLLYGQIVEHARHILDRFPELTRD